MTSSTGSVIFPQLIVNPNTSNFYDVTASLARLQHLPGRSPVRRNREPSHQPRAGESSDRQRRPSDHSSLCKRHRHEGQRLQVGRRDAVSGVGDRLHGRRPRREHGTAAVGSPTSATINQLQLGNGYLSPAVSTIQIFPGNYTFSAQSGTAASMTYAAPQTNVAVPNNYPTDLSKTVNLLMYASPVTANSTVTVTVKRTGRPSGCTRRGSRARRPESRKHRACTSGATRIRAAGCR